ncbi:metalloregulator ArsR/SmtB family transcription factor [Spirillospora sp. NPDC047279]|uniref:ArsR/SmtB family transcription factor n=1 Tax=Spirillospora sp. NPDC047279 TaxID=3155478 RepID=UPI0033E1A6F4
MDEVVNAIADPVRREILALLRAEPRSAGDIAARFPISRPAISRHLRVLRECGLVRDELVGRRRLYTLDPAPLTGLAEWITTLRAPASWDHRLDALETEVRRTTRDRRRTDGEGEGTIRERGRTTGSRKHTARQNATGTSANFSTDTRSDTAAHTDTDTDTDTDTEENTA